MFRLLPFERIDWVIKALLAQGLLVLLLLMNIVSLSLPHAGEFKPFFLLMGVYYWAIYRPTLIPSLYIFALGIVVDLQSGLPVGLSAFILVACKAMVQRQRLFLMGQPYITVWIVFALVAFLNAALTWGVMSLSVWSILPISSVLLAAGFSILVFPFVSLILLGVHRILPLPQSHFSH